MNASDRTSAGHRPRSQDRAPLADPRQPTVGLALFDRTLPPPHIIARHLTSKLGPEAKVSVTEGIVTAELDSVPVFVTPMPAPVPEAEALDNCHPLYCRDTEPIAEHQAHCIVSAVPLTTSHLPDNARIARTGVHLITAMVASALLKAPGAVGYCTAGTTFAAEVYRRAVDESQEDDERFPSTVLAPVWLRPEDDGTFSAYSFGLVDLGHPEVQVEAVDQAAPELFGTMCDIVDYVLHGATLEDGETIGTTPDERWSITAQPWLVDPEVPAVTLGM